MSLMGASSGVANGPPQSNKKDGQRRKRSLIRFPSSAGGSRSDNHSNSSSSSSSSNKPRYSRSVSYQSTTNTKSSGSMRFTNKKEGGSASASASRRPSDLRLVSVPETQEAPKLKKPAKRWTSLNQSRQPADEHPRWPRSPGSGSIFARRMSKRPSKENGSYPDILGIWSGSNSTHKRSATNTSTESEVETNSTVEVPFKLEQRPARPKIQLTIPNSARRSFSSSNRAPERHQQYLVPRTTQPSPVTQHHHQHRPATASVTASPFNQQRQEPLARDHTLRRSISLETTFPNVKNFSHSRDSSLRQAADFSSSSRSTSSADHYDDATSNYSHPSSVSSVDDTAVDALFGEPKQQQQQQQQPTSLAPRPVSQSGSVAFSIISPVAAGVFDEPKKMRKLKRSDLSNKPLPPEPKEMAPPPLSVPNRASPHSSSSVAPVGSVVTRRSTSQPQPHLQPFHAKPNPSGQQDDDATAGEKGNSNDVSPVSRGSMNDGVSNAQDRSPDLRASLKSKYSTTELDALDTAFRRASSDPAVTATAATTNAGVSQGVSLSEAEEALAQQLSTISEHVPLEWDIDLGLDDATDDVEAGDGDDEGEVGEDIDDLEDTEDFENEDDSFGPLQISRGPMAMSPSRAPPPTPPPALNPNRSNTTTRPPLSHVASQMRSPTRRPLPQRVDTSSSTSTSATSRWTAKAQKVLGRTTSVTVHTSKRANESPTKSPSKPDPAVAEIYKRLELLKMKQGQQSEFQLPIQAPAPESFKVLVADKPLVKLADQEARGSLLGLPKPRTNADRVPSLVSLAVSDIPDLYYNMPPSTQSIFDGDEDEDEEEENRQISANAAEAVLLRILQSLDSLKDLFSAAVVSKGFYRTFKRNELPLMKSALKGMSPAAWELREISPPEDDNINTSSSRSQSPDGSETSIEDSPVPEYTPGTYLRYFTRDMYIMVALKSLILVRCESFLRPETVSALAGNDDERSLQLDTAFWRVWTFCKIFGGRKNREDDIVGQMDWLRGGILANQETCTSTLATTDFAFGMNSALLNAGESFAQGNAEGLTPSDLWDMMEVWTCLGTLIEGLYGKTEHAREYGVYDGLDIPEGSEREGEVLEEWVAYILSLGPSVIIDLATPSEQSGPKAFAVAAENGWTDWTPPEEGGSRAVFLKEAMIRVYEEQVVSEKGSRRSPSPTESVASRASGASTTESTRQRIANHAAEIRAARRSSRFALLPPSDERPMSDWQAALRNFRTPAPSPRPEQTETSDPAPPVPALAAPAESELETPTTDKPQPASPARPAVPYKQPRLQQVDDPVDKAVWQMQGMGFSSEMAKQALAQTDTGENINVQAAIDLCLRRQGPPRGLGMQTGTGFPGSPLHQNTPSVDVSLYV